MEKHNAIGSTMIVSWNSDANMRVIITRVFRNYVKQKVMIMAQRDNASDDPVSKKNTNCPLFFLFIL